MSILELITKAYTQPSCFICGELTSDVCEGCAESVFTRSLPTCFYCNAYSKSYKTCSKCLAKGSPVHVWSAFEYKDEVSELVKKYKYQKVRTVGEAMSKHIYDAVPFDYSLDYVTYVPTATKRVRARGFDHAELLAIHVAKYLRKPCIRLLVKTNQHRQVGSSRTERQRIMNSSFRICHKTLIPNSRLLIIDDVVSTGSTLIASAKTLKRAGAKSIDAAVFARNLGK